MTDTDIRDLLGVFDRCQPAADDDIFYADVLRGLRELIPCDDITFQLMDVAEQRLRLLFVTDDGVHREESVGMERRVPTAVLAGVLGGGRLRRPAVDRRLLHAAPPRGGVAYPGLRKHAARFGVRRVGCARTRCWCR